MGHVEKKGSLAFVEGAQLYRNQKIQGDEASTLTNEREMGMRENQAHQGAITQKKVKSQTKGAKTQSKRVYPLEQRISEGRGGERKEKGEKTSPGEKRSQC